MKKTEKVLQQILLKMANGFTYTETTEEYVPQKNEQNGESLSLAKRKISTHYVPPDMLAIKILLENDKEKITKLSAMSDEELVELKKKLISDFMGGD